MGRPSIFTEKLASEICERVSNGETVSSVCRDDGMPHRTVIYDWMNKHESFNLQLARAREIGFDAIADELLTIVDETTEEPASRRVKADTRLKLLACWSPKKYGQKVDISSSDGSMSPKGPEHFWASLPKADDGPDE